MFTKYSKFLICAAIYSSAAVIVTSAPAVAVVSKTKIKNNKRKKQCKAIKSVVAPKQEVKTKLHAHKFIPSKLELDTNFQMNGTYVHRFDSMIYRPVLFNNTNNKSNDANMLGQFDTSKIMLGKKINYPENFFAPEMEVKLGMKWNEEFSRGSVSVKGGVKHNQIDSGENQFKPEISLDKAYFNLGPKNGINVELGKCDGPATTAFTDNKVFYRGYGKGIFGQASKELGEINTKYNSFQKSNQKSYMPPILITDSSDPANPYYSDANKVAHPYSKYFATEQIAGDDCGEQPKLAIYSPVLNRKNVSARIGVGSTLTSNAQDAIYISAGGYLDYKVTDSSTVRVSAAAGISAQTEDNLEYGRPMGVALGLAYLSKAIDIAYRTGYNGKSYTFNRSAGDLDVVNPFIDSDPKVIIQRSLKNWKYDSDQARGPWINSLKVRIDLGDDKDLTLGGFYSLRGTGFSDSSTNNVKEHVAGASIGFNMPISNIPFRAGAELTYAKVINDAHLMEYRFTKMHTDQIVMFGIGVNYAPIVDLDDNEGPSVLNTPLTQDTDAYNIE